VRGLDSLKVVPFVEEHLWNDYPEGNLTWQMYHSVRNDIVRVCRRYGPTGPMGEVKIDVEVADPYAHIAEDIDFWEDGDPNPAYYILTDQYNHERYCYAELFGDDPFNAGWLLSITAVSREHMSWGLTSANTNAIA